MFAAKHCGIACINAVDFLAQYQAQVAIFGSLLRRHRKFGEQKVSWIRQERGISQSEALHLVAPLGFGHGAAVQHPAGRAGEAQELPGDGEAEELPRDHVPGAAEQGQPGETRRHAAPPRGEVRERGPRAEDPRGARPRAGRRDGGQAEPGRRDAAVRRRREGARRGRARDP